MSARFTSTPKINSHFNLYELLRIFVMVNQSINVKLPYDFLWIEFNFFPANKAFYPSCSFTAALPNGNSLLQFIYLFIGEKFTAVIALFKYVGYCHSLASNFSNIAENDKEDKLMSDLKKRAKRIKTH